MSTENSTTIAPQRPPAALVTQGASARPPALDVPAFLRLFQLRTTQIMWFLGAGASRAAGIKTANDMIWDFKQYLYRSQKKLGPSSIADIGDPIVRRRLQDHFDSLRTFPLSGSEAEYAAYFEATYHSPKDRRAYLAALIERAQPSFGHMALCLLMAENLSRAIWTSNFDRALEDAAAKLFGGTGRLLVADLAEPEKLRSAWSESRWPVYAKLHGDYHSDHLKNTGSELQAQDAEMRRQFVQACRSQGLAIVGYSGRDASIMDALTEALDGGRGFPGGLFWFKRHQTQPFPAVTNLIAQAQALGIDAHLVDAESFDELLSDVVRFLPQTADKVQSLSGSLRPRLAKSTLRPASANTPAVRMHALPILAHPAICRLIDCEIGGFAEIRDAIEAAGVNIDAQRCRDGVLAFGRDADIRRAFESRGIKVFDTRPIRPNRLIKESGDRALLRDALFRAVARGRGLRIRRRGHTSLVMPDPTLVDARAFNTDNVKPVDRVSGTVPKTIIPWTEACGLRLDYRFERLWLLLEPQVALDIAADTPQSHIELARDFVRERRARRHNRPANALLDGWVRLIVGDTPTIRLKAFEISDGIDAEFEIERITGFSGIAQ